MRALEFVTGHVIFKLRYNQIYQLKTTYGTQKKSYIDYTCLSGPWNQLTKAKSQEDFKEAQFTKGTRNTFFPCLKFVAFNSRTLLKKCLE